MKKSNMNALEIKNLTKTYPQFTLKNVNLSVPKGSIVGLVGSNGVGKSTTINCIFDIVKKDSGEVLFYGEHLENKDLKNKIGVVFDTLAYSTEITIHKLSKVLIDLYSDFDTRLFNDFVRKFNLPTNEKLKAFSRGMTMQLSIAVALSHGAKLLILDEATAGLDPMKREEILDIFLDFIQNEENAILMSSHITSDLEKIADYITFIDKGEIILTENKDTLIYEYGIAKLRDNEFEKLGRKEYISHRKRGMQIEVLIKDKAEFSKNYPTFVVDNATLDAVAPLLTKEAF